MNDDFRDMMPTSEEFYSFHSKYDYVVKACKRCDNEVEMSSDHGICDSCASQAERGWEY